MFLSSGGFGHGKGIGPGVKLDEERAKASFDVAKLRNLIYGGEKHVERRRFINQLVENDPVFRKWDNMYLDRPALYRRGLEKTKRYIEVIKENNLVDDNELYWLRTAIDELLPIGLHHSMFIPTLREQLNDEQRAHWMPQALNYSIIGCYAQTEMFHGSFIRGLEATATFDPATDEFVVDNAKTISAAKWWPGNLGLTANHCILMAQLIVGSKNYGLHPFIVQLRDLNTHMPLPGVQVGDIGPKLAYEMNDNGYLVLKQVRIPRVNMAMRFASLTRDGKYEPAQNAKLSYGTMVFVRSWIIIESSRGLARALTVAIRYSAIRLQFPIVGPTKTKTSHPPTVAEHEQILNYQSQQYFLFPLLATAFAFHFVGSYMKKLYLTNVERIKKGDISLLKEVHVNSSGLKALTTSVVSVGIETCRRACGGHGYSRFSGLIELYGNLVPAETYEGENTLMFLQTARELVQTWNAARDIPVGSHKRGKAKLSGGMAMYANDVDPNIKSGIKQESDWLNLDLCLEAFTHRTVRLLGATTKRLNKFVLEDKTSFEFALDQMKIELIRCAKAHCAHLCVQIFINALKTLKEPSVRPIITTLCQLFALTWIERDLGDFTEDGYLNLAQTDAMRSTIRHLLNVIRPDAVAIVDSFDFSDHYLNSALGRFDGNCYETMFQWANMGNPMNASPIGPGVKEILLPLQKAARESMKSKL